MEHSTESEEDEYAFVVNVKKLEAENDSETIDLLLGGVVVRNVVLDSGSSCNIVDQKTWEELKSNSIKLMQVREVNTETVPVWLVKTS